MTHTFSYDLYQLYLDTDELDQVFAGRLLWSVDRRNVATVRRSDFLGDPAVSLGDAVRALVRPHTGARPLGPVRLLTHPRVLGLRFNPVSFYHVFERDGETVAAVVAEITNTPWLERRAYVLAARDGRLRFRIAKDFHVSPFQPMDLTYDWRFGTPGRVFRARLRSRRGDDVVFEATLRMERRPLSAATLAGALLRHPVLPLQVLFGIYAQAARLFLKGARHHVHPRTRLTAATGSAT